MNTGHTHGLGSITSADGAHHDQLSTTSGSHEHDGGEHQHSWDNRPQYYVLAFIIKIN